MRARRVRVPSLSAVLAPTPGLPSTQRSTKTSRFLFAVPPFTGHILPTVAVAAELVRRGHKVAWVGHRDSIAPLTPRHARIYDADGAPLVQRLRDLSDGDQELLEPAALRSLWEQVLVPLGHAMMPGVQNALDRFRPDVVVSDQQALAAPVAARLRGLPWATSAATPVELTRPLRDLPEDEERVRELIGDFQLDHGIEDLLDPRFSDHLVLVFSTGALVGDAASFPDRFVFVGPCSTGSAPAGPRTDDDVPREWPDGRPAVLVTLGTARGAAAERFLRAAVEAVAGLDVRAVVVAPPGALADPPPNVLVRRDVPRSALLERMAAGPAVVLCRGGHRTVCRSLAHGLPLVLAPTRYDHSVIARRVAEAGAAIIVRFDQATPVELRAALGAVLTDEDHRRAAARLRRSFAEAGGAAEAADRLEKLA